MEYLSSDRIEIPVKGDDVRPIASPADFYQLIIDKIESSNHRVYLSSLYLGDGKLENALIDALSSRLDSQPDLDVTVLVDYLRGRRGEKEQKSSTTLLKRIAQRANVFLYHTPSLRGITRSLLPERTNEIVGLQHMKLYIFDDSILISGANLSDSYFTNRQDRYVLIENSPRLANFFCQVISAVGSCSFVLDEEGNTTLSPSAPDHPHQGCAEGYCAGVRSRLKKVIEDTKKTEDQETSSTSDTVIVPLIQMGPFGIHEEYDMLKKLFASKDSSLEMTLASGYFNAIAEYEDLMLREGKYSLRVLMAAPEANGFAGASGLSGHVPSMYTAIAAAFLRALPHKNERVSLLEWSRPGWSFHAKGIWMDFGNRVETIVGSSNYGYRSVHRDLEAQIVVSTTNPALMARLRDERNALLEYSSVVDASVLRRSDHHVPVLLKFISRFIRNFF